MEESKNKKRYSYIKKKLSRGTWLSLGLGGLSLLLFILCLVLSVFFEGEGPLLIGALGLSSLLCSGTSLTVVLQNYGEKNRNRTGIRIAGIGSGVLTFLWIILIFVGLRLS